MNNVLRKSNSLYVVFCCYLFDFILCSKTNKIKYLLFFFSLLINFNSVSQSLNTKKIDSLESLFLKKDNSLVTKAKIYGCLAEEYQGLEPDKSLYHAEKLLAISKKIKYNKGITDYYRIAAKNYISLGDYNKALTYGEKASKEYLRVNDSLNYFKNSSTLVQSYYRNGDIDKAIEIAVEILSNSNNLKYNFEKGDLCYHLCVMYNIKNNIDQALLYIGKAEKFYSLSKNGLKGFVKCYQQRSQIYSKTNQNKKAITYAEKSLKGAIDLGAHEQALSIFYTTLGIAYFNNDNNKEAIYNLNKAAQINKYDGTVERKNFNLVMLSQAYFGLKKYNDAIRVIKETLTKRSNPETQLMAYGTIGNSYYEMQNYDAALKNQLMSLDLLKEVDDVEHQRSIYLDISKTYYKLGNYKLAHEFLNKYQEAEIKFLREVQEKNINDLEIKYDSKQKDLALKNLTILRQKQKLEILEEKSFTAKLSIIIVSILIALTILVISLFINKKKNRLLNIKNEIISDKIMLVEEQKVKLSQSLFERELLLKEIHHRVKNNLQVVISLLSIQAMEGDKTNIDDFLEKGQSRINSMALIHQSLYENDRLDNINFNDYLLKLIDDLKNLLKIPNTDITFNINAIDIFLDIQTAIPLGLIVNELFSNAFKHAFRNLDRGEIKISIEKVDDMYYEMQFSDNGNGYSEENSNKKSLGLELVSLLVRQLKGKITKENCKGTGYKIIFKEIIN